MPRSDRGTALLVEIPQLAQHLAVNVDQTADQVIRQMIAPAADPARVEKHLVLANPFLEAGGTFLARYLVEVAETDCPLAPIGIGRQIQELDDLAGRLGRLRSEVLVAQDQGLAAGGGRQAGAVGQVRGASPLAGVALAQFAGGRRDPVREAVAPVD